MKKAISWQYYIDPLDNIKNQEQIENIEDIEDTENSEVLTPYEKQEQEQFEGRKKIISTPLGLLTISDDTLASKQFDLWIMHTNFDITPKILQEISKIRGVESLEPLTRYRARIGFPKSETIDESGNRVPMFDSKTIKKEIEDTLLTQNIFNPRIDTLIISQFGKDIYDKFTELKTNTLLNNEYWTLLILPNGEFEYIATDSNKEYITQHQILENTYIMVYGLLISYLEYNK